MCAFWPSPLLPSPKNRPGELIRDRGVFFIRKMGAAHTSTCGRTLDQNGPVTCRTSTSSINMPIRRRIDPPCHNLLEKATLTIYHSPIPSEGASTESTDMKYHSPKLIKHLAGWGLISHKKFGSESGRSGLYMGKKPRVSKKQNGCNFKDRCTTGSDLYIGIIFTREVYGRGGQSIRGRSYRLPGLTSVRVGNKAKTW